MKIIEMNIENLIPYEKNPRNNADAIGLVANSIREFGFKVPIIVDVDNVIVAGHTRYLAAQQLGMESVPCIMADDLTPEQVKAFRLADNKVAEVATWDNELLNLELTDLKVLDFEMSDFGFFNDLETLPINDEDVETSTTFEHKMKIDNKVVIMTEEEANMLLEKYEKYIEDNGVSYGFVRWLLCEQ